MSSQPKRAAAVDATRAMQVQAREAKASDKEQKQDAAKLKASTYLRQCTICKKPRAPGVFVECTFCCRQVCDDCALETDDDGRVACSRCIDEEEQE